MSIDVPSGWGMGIVEDVCTNLDRKRIPLNSEQRNSMKGDIPYWGANNIVDYVNDHIFDEPLVLMAEDGGNFENSANRPICQLLNGKAWVNNHAHEMRVKEGTHREWVYYWFVNRDITPFINGGTRSKLNQSDLNELSLLLPPLPEQKKIAEVLGSVDAAIAASEAVIAQTGKARHAIIQAMIAPAAAMALQREKPPRGWQATSLGKVLEHRKAKGKPDIPVAGITMNRGLVRRDTIERRVISDLLPEEHLLVCKGDIAYNTMRMWQGVSGLACEDCIVSPAYVVLRPTDELISEFAALMLREAGVVRLLHGYSQGVTDDRLRLYYQHFAKIPIALPALEHQKLAVQAIAPFRKTLQTEQTNLAQLKRVKKGLMADLLTGKKRVAM